ncbi:MULTISPECIES: hypothetical protein [unclassified Bradyrhizobium]|uniref:hypothetical protein n=1 Tax=unclassified Bradyrhizobium TaxID=2631580 RepID=UPI001FFC1737|nr:MULTISPECIES: hypothetical protein [unclassified Bradyrhizobium]MCK1496626.1 hypothetical protein [Bradyrhizobium sp. 188]MCK1535805.1 hypothetical protein [Bradyrhizobium sp. 176]MCK1552568.1 hypothetical protein [Bradyrhizobium sp. 177]MCK1555368.1 hypothetical protein [Bradyrhizobium sp. 171]MCK1615023.1 hypothetical protein [Bradyrhizobium sp. 163]
MVTPLKPFLESFQVIPPQINLELDATYLYTGIRREASSKATLLDICAGVLEPASAEGQAAAR